MARAHLGQESYIDDVTETTYAIKRSLSINADNGDTLTIPLEVGNQDQWESDDKTATAVVDALSAMGYTVIVPAEQRQTSTFTSEELTVLSGTFTIEKKDT